jgi:hypothetical protein
MEIINEKLLMENINDFQLLLIKSNNIDHLDYYNPNYLDHLINTDYFEIIDTNNNNFIKTIGNALLINKENLNVKSQIIIDMPNYIYELLYIIEYSQEKDKINENYPNDTILPNQIATLINTNGATINGNAILMKTFIPIDKKNMIIDNCNKYDIKSILDSRINTSIVTYDDEWKEEKVFGNIEEFANDFFDDIYTKYEIPFLLYNINIWYEVCNGCSTSLLGNIISKPIYKCIIFTMLNDEYRGNITLSEVNKIIDIAQYMQFPFSPHSDWIAEEYDQYKRPVIKNKYRVLESAHHFFCKK